MKGYSLNRKIEQVEMAHAMAIAVADVMDKTLGKGQGKILESWTEQMLDEMPPEERNKKVFTQEALTVLNKMPVVVTKIEE